MFFMMDFTEEDIAREPCVLCGQPSKRILGHDHTPGASFAVPEGMTRFLLYGMCQKCFDHRQQLSKAKIRELAAKLLKQEAQGTSPAVRPKSDKPMQ